MYCIIFGNTFVNLSGNPHPAPSPFSFAKVGLFEPYAVSEPSLNNKLKFFAEIDRKFQRVLKWDGYTLMLQMNSGTQNLSSPLSLYMGFSDETEVAMITIDEATASRDYTQRRYWFAFLIKFDNFSRALTAKKPAEKCAAPLRVLVLCWAYYYLSMESNSWYATISLEKNRRFNRKRATKLTSAGTHCTEARLKATLRTLFSFCCFYLHNLYRHNMLRTFTLT